MDGKILNIATIIVNWNGKDDLLECLDSIRKQKSGLWQNTVVVVDNGSTDGSVELVHKHYPDIVLLSNDFNLGFTGGNNQAMRWAIDHGFDAMLLLNNDTVIGENDVNLLVETWQRHENVGAVMPVIHYYGTNEVWYSGGSLKRPWGRVQHSTKILSSTPNKIEIFTACCILLPTEVIKQVGMFNEQFYLYLEDTDLALRINSKGYSILVDPRTSIQHKVSRSSGGSQTPNPIYYQIRNNILLIRLHSRDFLEKLLGILYVLAISIKIALNVFTRNMPHKRQILTSIYYAWLHSLKNKWGQRH